MRMEKKSTRVAYGEALVKLGKVNKDVVVLEADLSKSTMTAYFKKEFPERHINVGIAEADMIGTAAGIATTGKIPLLQLLHILRRDVPLTRLETRWHIRI